ncbi:MAG TPA: hypothetical protein VEJ63_04190 [Planctomycetota bacterium]|nr:hypothetical protein [Planctomycetota bacterium]
MPRARFVPLLTAFLTLSFALSAADEAPKTDNDKEKEKAKNAFKLPDGDAHAGWELFLKNDFAAAEASFKAAITKDAADLHALEGLRASHVARGNYKESQNVTLQMLSAATEPGVVEIFCSRAQDGLNFTESRQAFLDTLKKLADTREGAAQAVIRDYLASLYLRTDNTEEAKKALQGIGYIDQWQFVAGPFGSKDKNDPYNRRYSPERALKTLELTDERGEKVKVATNVPVPQRALDLNSLFPNARGNAVFYAFTNLESDSEQDVIIGYAGSTPSKVFLRGLPVLQQPDDEEFQRSGVLVRTRLVKGNNPILVKLQGAFSVTMRVLDLKYAPLKDVRIKPLPPEELAKHEASPLRGIVAGKRVNGMVAEYLMQRVAPEDRMRTRWMRALLDQTLLRTSEAAWAEQAAQRENDLRARLMLGRAIAAYAPDSVGALDLAAHIITNAGRGMGNSDARQVEEAKRLREHALTILPTSHQHLLGLHDFYEQRELPDQAFEKIKACAEAHPQSPLALAELASDLARKQFMVEAEQYLEKAAALDDAYLGRLAWHHDMHGNKVRARELRQKQIALGQIDPDFQLEQAFKEGNLQKAEELLASLQKSYPDRAEDFERRRVRLLIDKNELQAAFDLQRKIYDKLPKSDDRARREPLVSLVDLALQLKKEDDARTLLKEYLKDTPGDYELRHRLSDLEGGSIGWWEPYDVKVSEIDTSRYTAERYKNSNHAWIVDFMVTRIMPDLSRESYVHIAQKVLNVKGINELSEVLVQAQRNQIVFIRTLNPDGTSFMPQNVHNFNLAQTASAYKVGPGSILEHAYLEHQDADKDEPALTMGFNFNAVDAPRAISRWTVLVANEAIPKLNFRKIRPELVEEKILPGPPGYTVYQWTNKQVEGIKFEPLMPGEGDQEVIPLVTIETADQPYRGSGWLRRQEREHLPPEAAAEAKRIVADVEAGEDESEEAAKFDAIVQWVRANIQPGQDSRTLDDVWFSRSGNAGQMTTLVREMAQSVDLKVRTAFINANYQPGKVWKSKNAKRQWEPFELANFGGGFVLVLETEDGPDRWAQFVGQSPKYYNPNQLNPNQAGAFALTMGEDGARIKRVNGEALGLTSMAHRATVQLDKEGTGKIDGTLAFYGNYGGNVREGLSNPQRTQQIKEWVVRNWWPKIQTPEIEVIAQDVPELPIVFEYSGSVKRLGGAEADGRTVLNPYLNRARILDLRGQQERVNDMLLRNEFADLDHTITYVAPEGCGWLEVPDDLFIVTEFGWFLSDYNVKGRTLTCTRSYLLPQQRVTPEKYAAFQKFLNAISADQQQRVGYGPLKNETFGNVAEPVFSGGYAGIGE